MPIKPENKKRYPISWKVIRAAILFECNNCCEFCGVENGKFIVRSKDTFRYVEVGDWVDDDEKVTKIVLTIAHLDHTPENCHRENLKALCQKCHLTYDVEHHRKSRSSTKYRKLEEKGQQTIKLSRD